MFYLTESEKKNVCKKNIIFVLGESQGIFKSSIKEMDYFYFILSAGAVSAFKQHILILFFFES